MDHTCSYTSSDVNGWQHNANWCSSTDVEILLTCSTNSGRNDRFGVTPLAPTKKKLQHPPAQSDDISRSRLPWPEAVIDTRHPLVDYRFLVDIWGETGTHATRYTFYVLWASFPSSKWMTIKVDDQCTLQTECRTGKRVISRWPKLKHHTLIRKYSNSFR